MSVPRKQVNSLVTSLLQVVVNEYGTAIPEEVWGGIHIGIAQAMVPPVLCEMTRNSRGEYSLQELAEAAAVQVDQEVGQRLGRVQEVFNSLNDDSVAVESGLQTFWGTQNAFCPTGKGGGQDNSCSSKEGSNKYSSGVIKVPIEPGTPYEREIPVRVNLGKTELHNYLSDRFRRGLVDGDGNLYVWEAGSAVHEDIIKGLKLDRNKVKVYFDTQEDGSGRKFYPLDIRTSSLKDFVNAQSVSTVVDKVFEHKNDGPYEVTSNVTSLTVSDQQVKVLLNPSRSLLEKVLTRNEELCGVVNENGDLHVWESRHPVPWEGIVNELPSFSTPTASFSIQNGEISYRVGSGEWEKGQYSLNRVLSFLQQVGAWETDLSWLPCSLTTNEGESGLSVVLKVCSPEVLLTANQENSAVSGEWVPPTALRLMQRDLISEFQSLLSSGELSHCLVYDVSQGSELLFSKSLGEEKVHNAQKYEELVLQATV